MADNVAITAGSGTSIATDDVGGVQYQKVKIDVGGDGASLPLSTTNPIPVELPSATVTTLTPPAAITGFATAAKQLPDGHSVALSATDNAVLDNIDTNTDSGAVVGGGTEATAQRVTIANDSTGVVSIDDNGGAITVDGTVAVTNAGITTIAGAVAGTEMQVDVVAALPAGTNVIGAVKRDVINYTAVRKYYTYSGAVTDGIVWSPASGKKWVITDLIINTSAAAVVTLEEDLAGGDSPIMKFELAANGGVSTNFQTPLMGTEDDADLIITTSAGNIYVTVIGYEID
jgi:hypothetical protein